MDISDEELKNYIGKDAGYYLDKFEDLKNGKKSLINVYAFFGGVIWIFYRKMNLYGFIIIGAISLEIILEDIVLDLTGTGEEFRRILDTYIPILGCFLIGFYGNYLYKKHVYKQIKKIKEKNISDSHYHDMLRKKGGVTYIPILIFLLLVAAAIVLGRQQ